MIFAVSRLGHCVAFLLVRGQFAEDSGYNLRCTAGQPAPASDYPSAPGGSICAGSRRPPELSIRATAFCSLASRRGARPQAEGRGYRADPSSPGRPLVAQAEAVRSLTWSRSNPTDRQHSEYHLAGGGLVSTAPTGNEVGAAPIKGLGNRQACPWLNVPTGQAVDYQASPRLRP